MRPSLASATLLSLVVAALGCDDIEQQPSAAGGASQAGASQGGTQTAGGQGNKAGASGSQGGAGPRCEVSQMTHAVVPSPHVAECSRLDFTSDPPSSGAHYGVWAAFKSYAAPVPRGYYLHSLEHGGVVVAYNCPGGCADEVAMAQAVLDGIGPDPRCPAVDEPGVVRKRFLLTPDPSLASRWGAAFWGQTLSAPCFDPAAFRAFIESSYAQKPPEDLCIEGTDVVAKGIPAGCGQ